MSQSQKSTAEVKPAASFSDVLENKQWGPELRKAAEAGSVAMVAPDEQPSADHAASPSKPRRPR